MELLNLCAKISIDKAEYDRGLEEASSEAHSFGDKLKSGLGSAVKAGAAALAGAANAMTGFGAASVKTGMEFDASMAQVAATMGKTVDEIGDLRDFAMEMGSKTAFSATEAANALNYMALAGYDAETSMKMLPNVLDLAAAGGMDLASASDMITDSQSALGLSLEETSSLVDKMAKASSKSNTDVAQLGAAILTVGGTAKDLAGGTTELATALGILADNGIKGAEGGTALRNIILSLGAPTDKAAKVMSSLGIKAFDSSGKMRPLADIFRDLNNGMAELSTEERQDILSNLFNKVDMKSASALMSAASSGVADMSAELKKAGIQWEKYADTAWMANSGIDGVVEEIAYNLETLGTSAEELQDYLHFEYDMDYADAAAAIKVVNRMIGQSGDRWDELSGHIDDAAGAASKMAETQLDTLAGDVTIFKSALEGAKIQVSNRLTPALRDFVKIGTSGLSKMTEGFRKGGLSGAMEALGGTISTVLEKVVDILPDVIEAGGRLLAAVGQGILDNIDSITDTATEIVIMLVQGLTGALPEIGKGAAELVSKLAEGIGEALPDLIPAAVEAVAGFAEALIDNADKIVDGAVALMEGLAKGIVNAIPILVKKIPVLIEKLVKAIITNAPKIFKAGVELLGQLVKGLFSGETNVIGFISEILIGKWILKTILGKGKALFDAGKSLLGKLVGGMGEGMKGASGIIDGLVQKVSGGAGAAAGAGTAGAGAAGAGATGAGVAGTVAAHAGTIAAGAVIGAGLGTAIVDWTSGKSTGSTASEIYEAFDDGSYKEAFRLWGEDIAEGGRSAMKEAWYFIYQEADEGSEKVRGVVAKSAEVLAKEFETFKENAKTAASGLWEPFSSQAESVWNTVKDIFEGAWEWLENTFDFSLDGIMSTLGSGMDNVGKTISDTWEGLKGAFSEGWAQAEGSTEEGTGSINASMETLSGTWEGIKAAFSEGWSQVEGSTEEGTAATTAAVSSGMASTESAAATGLETIKGAFQGAWENLKGGAEGGSKSILGTVKGMLSSIGNEAESTSGKAKTWGSDMMENFNKGVSSWKDKIAETVRGIAEKIKKNIGFSEPEEGPLSDFHTYAPDMMQLFISGIKQNEKALMNQVNKTFDFSEAVVQPPQPEVAARMAAAGAKGAAAGAAQPQSVTVILELDKQQLAKAVYSLNNSERQRVGLSLAKGFA